MPKPTITALIDTHNHERFIEQALVSVVEQDFPPSEMEILVVDDGSTDGTREIVRKFAPRVRLMAKINGGQGSAFNFGIPEALGQFVAFLDGDDWWAPNKLARVAETITENPSLGVIGHGLIEANSEAKHLRSIVPAETGTFDLETGGGAQTFRNYMAFLGTSRVTIRKTILSQVLPIPETLVFEADEFMSAACVALSRAKIIPEPLTFYRLHDGNLYQFRSGDLTRARRKQIVLESLCVALSHRLASMGIEASTISIIVEPIRLSALRIKLSLDGGSRVETYRLEKAELSHSYSRLPLTYCAWKLLSLALTLLLPPRQYYQARELYATLGLRRLRSWLGEPQPRALVNQVQLHSKTLHVEK